MGENVPQDTAAFEQQKTNYFVRLGVRHKDLIAIHRDEGQVSRSEEFGVDEDGKEKRWGDPTQHCMVEGAVAEIFSDMLALSEPEKQALVTAALVHDAGKRSEIEAVKAARAAGKTNEEIDAVNDAASEASKQRLLQAGIDPFAVELVDSVAHTSIGQFVYLDEANTMHLRDDVPTAKMAMHYIDDITWGTRVVPFDERIDGLESVADRYPYNEAGRAVWGGRTYFEAQRESGHLIEARLAEIAGVSEPTTLPDIINQHLYEQIMGEAA